MRNTKLSRDRLVVTTRVRGDVKVLRLKSCPKCKTGDLAIDRDHHGWYEYCIQCGYQSDLVSVAESKPKPVSGSKKRPTLPDKGD
jgi:Zn ribbon nucleic-acid-binding protein